jgi:ABC-type phosphate/phosphonate transport system substrate-binding protein
MPRTTAALTVAAAAIAAAAIAGCSAAPKPQITAAQATRGRAIQSGDALDITRSQDATPKDVPVLRLGILATPADTTGLTAIGLGYVAAKLSTSDAHLNVTAYTTPAAEANALITGTIDAAYTTPTAARTARQNTGNGVRIIAGANQTSTGTTAVVLAARTTYLRAHGPQITSLLQGHIQAVALLTTDPATAIPAARTELQALLHATLSPGTTTAFNQYRATSSPGATGIHGLLDLAPINILLRASGLPPA